MEVATIVDSRLVFVAESSIHGKGLFAARDIQEDELIGIYDGPRTLEDGPYVLWVEDENEQPIGIDGQNEVRYVNHDINANAAFYGAELIAIRDIKVGEEITHHYGDDWVDEEDWVEEGELIDEQVGVDSEPQ